MSDCDDSAAVAKNLLATETSTKEHNMTGYTVHSGTTIKFSEGWDRVFQESGSKIEKAKKVPKKIAASGSAKTKGRAKRAAKKR